MTAYDHVRIAIEHAALALGQVRAPKPRTEHAEFNLLEVLDNLKDAVEKWESAQ